MCPTKRGVGLAGDLSRLAHAIALTEWNPDYIYGFVRKELVLKGFPLKEGFMRMLNRPEFTGE